jgi:hypothetical protein
MRQEVAGTLILERINALKAPVYEARFIGISSLDIVCYLLFGAWIFHDYEGK